MQPNPSSPRRTCVRFRRRLEPVLDEALGVPREIAAVFPQVAPDAEDARQLVVDHRGRERLERDRALVARLGEAAEDAVEIDVPGAQVAAPRLADVEVAE